MADTLGRVAIDLTVNAANFVSGFAAASAAAKRAGSEITESFSRVGELAASALAPFGEVGRAIGETFSTVGRLAGSASQELAKLSGGMTLLTVGAGAAAGAIAGVNIAAIGLAIHTAESVREMNDQARAAGVSVDKFSALSFAAKQAGIPQEALSKTLGVLSKNMVKAAETAPGTATVFTRLGLNIKDSNGQLKDAGSFLVEVIEKLDSLKDRTAAIGFSREIFGRGGQEMMKFDPAEMQDSMETAKKLGIVIGPEFAEASTKFVQSMNVMKAAGEGLALQLTEKLLPTMQLLADEIIKAFENNRPAIAKFVDEVADLVKQSVAHLYEFITIARNVALWLNAVQDDSRTFGETTRQAIIGGVQGGIGGAVKGAQEGSVKLHLIWEKYREDERKMWQQNSNLIENIIGPRAPFTLDHSVKKDRNLGADLSPKEKGEDSILARIKERIAQLGIEESAWLKIGQAGSQAEQLIAEAVKKGSEEYAKLRDTAAREKDPKQRTIDLGLVTANEGFIKSSAAAGVFGAAIESIDKELDKQRLRLEEEIPAIDAIAAAYSSGGLAAATVTAHFADQAAKVQVLKESHDLLAAELGEENARVRQLAEGYALASQKLATDEALYATEIYKKLNVEIIKSTDAFNRELPALQAISAAYFDTAEAARAAQIELKVAQFKTANPTADEGQVNQFRELEKKKSDQAFQNSISEQAAKYDLIHAYDEEMERLERLRQKLIEKHSSTMLIDAQEYDTQRRAIQQWDEAALKVGSYGDKFRAVMNQVILDGQNFGQKLAQSIGKAIDGLSSSLAKFIVTGKGGFKQLFQSLEEEILKASIQKGFSALLGKLFGGGDKGAGAGGSDQGVGGLLGKIPVIGGALSKLGGLFGLGGGPGKADGSKSNPFYVVSAGGEQGGPGGLSGLLSSFGGGGEGGDSGGGGAGGFLGLLGSFAGFLADGGDVTPGKAYVVGEKHPEFFLPKQPGHVTPSLKMGGDTVHHQTTVNFHVHGVQDVDSFRRSQSQIFGDMHRQMTIAHARNY